MATIREALNTSLAKLGSATARDIVTDAKNNNLEYFREQAEQDQFNMWVRTLGDILRQQTQNEVELAMPDVTLPTRIAVPQKDGDTIYVLTENAKWEDLQAGKRIRDANEQATSKKNRRYDKSLRKLQPHMENSPDRTVGEVVGLGTFIKVNQGINEGSEGTVTRVFPPTEDRPYAMIEYRDIYSGGTYLVQNAETLCLPKSGHDV
jgi:hypothetical protein